MKILLGLLGLILYFYFAVFMGRVMRYNSTFYERVEDEDV